jgi:hypothetical protein
MADAENSRAAEILARVEKLKDDAALNDAADRVSRLETEATVLRQRIQNLGGKGYTALPELDASGSVLAGAIAKVKTIAEQRLSAYREALADELLDVQESAAAGTDENALAAAESAAAALEGQIRSAGRDLEDLAAPLSKASNDLDRHLSLIQHGVEQWEGFTGQRESGESVILAADAEWIAGSGRDEAPDGTLYLTNRRLIFEQDEKVGKRLGLFGGKQVREVEWAIDLSGIGGLTAKNAGLLGGKDMLYFSHSGREYTLEVKGRATNDDWAAYIERVKSGAFAVPSAEIAAPDQRQHSEILERLKREQGERLNARRARQLAAEAHAAQDQAKKHAAAQAAGAMGTAASSLFGRKDAAGDETGDEKKLSGLAAAFRKASDDPDDGSKPAAKGGEKGSENAGPSGGKAG